MPRGLRPYLMLGLLSALSLGGYLLFSAQTYASGFPLDDSWIHQTYARNLVQNGEWAFISGVPSAGSTAPLWSGLIALGYALRLNPLLWAYFLGWASLFGLAVCGLHIMRSLFPDGGRWVFAAGLLLALEWHLVWAGGAGMETILLAFIVLLCFAWLFRLQQGKTGRERNSTYFGALKLNWLALGALVGLGVWVRPDALTLLGPIGLVALMAESSWKGRLSALLVVVVGFLSFFGPYLFFNRALAGAWWPNTFYAKQAEYAILRQLPLWLRFLQQGMLPLVGVGALLLPGFAFLIVKAARGREWATLAAAIWLAGFLGLYAWRLPVTYQHGRYIIPAMPVFFLLGLAGVAFLFQPRSPHLFKRVVTKAWILSIPLTLLAFWFLGGRAYAQDVAIIESEMVASAIWVNANTEQKALIAAHDIGALGYFGERGLLDLAGLVSPEVIPFIRDEAALAEYLDSQGADYLVTFPGWYPSLVDGLTVIYQTGGTYSPSLGGENMAVYRWNSPID